MPDTDELDELPVEVAEDDAPEVEAVEVEAATDEPDDDDGEVIVAFDGEEPIASAANVLDVLALLEDSVEP